MGIEGISLWRVILKKKKASGLLIIAILINSLEVLVKPSKALISSSALALLMF